MSSSPNTQDDTSGAPPGEVSNLAQVVIRNIDALLEVRRREERKRSLQDRIADAITKFAGSMAFVYIHLIVFGLWIVINLGWLPIKRFDPTLVVLAMFASVEAIFLSTFVLISQNRMSRVADERADLDLHISLLAEHEITRILTTVDAIAQRMDLNLGQEPDMEELKQDVTPETVLREMEEHKDGHNGH